MAKRSKQEPPRSEQPEAVPTRIAVAGFKSIREEQSIELRPLTILAGANSSGKSSMVQPLLLMKQTLEATYDPGPLLLNGPNVRFTDAAQLLSRTLGGEPAHGFQVTVEFSDESQVMTRFRRRQAAGLELGEVSVADGDIKLVLTPEAQHAQVLRQLPKGFLDQIEKAFKDRSLRWHVERERCFLRLYVQIEEKEAAFRRIPFGPPPLLHAERFLRNVVHLPALRGSPRRTYPVTAVGKSFVGTFDNYVASVVAKWQAGKAEEALSQTREDLESLGLSWIVEARPINDAEVELQVSRLPRAVHGGERDLVSIADVGFGVSQALPVVVALHAAGPEHLVYLEQPETHLHPRAQVAMASVLARAVQRGVRVLIETHSPLLLLAVQHLVATGTMSPDAVKLHWFTRSDEDGATSVTSADLDDAGAFGDWPEDFGDVEMDIEKRYLDAAEARMSCK